MDFYVKKNELTGEFLIELPMTKFDNLWKFASLFMNKNSLTVD